MIRSIPNIIEGDRMMINKLQEEREATETSLADQYLPLHTKCQALQGQLDYFYAAKVYASFQNCICYLTYKSVTDNYLVGDKSQRS